MIVSVRSGRGFVGKASRNVSMQVPRGNGQLGVQWFVREFECGRIEGRPSRRGGRMRSRRRGRMSNALASATTSTSAITKSLCERYWFGRPSFSAVVTWKKWTKLEAPHSCTYIDSTGRKSSNRECFETENEETKNHQVKGIDNIKTERRYSLDRALFHIVVNPR